MFDIITIETLQNNKIKRTEKPGLSILHSSFRFKEDKDGDGVCCRMLASSWWIRLRVSLWANISQGNLMQNVSALNESRTLLPYFPSTKIMQKKEGTSRGRKVAWVDSFFSLTGLFMLRFTTSSWFASWRWDPLGLVGGVMWRPKLSRNWRSLVQNTELSKIQIVNCYDGEGDYLWRIFILLKVICDSFFELVEFSDVLG